MLLKQLQQLQISKPAPELIEVIWLLNVCEGICSSKYVKCECWWLTANVSKKAQMSLKGKCTDTNRLNLPVETNVQADTHHACRWRTESADGDSGWPQLIHRSSAGGRRSGPCLPPTLSHSLLAPPDNGLRERERGKKTDNDIVIHRLDSGRKKGGRKKGVKEMF